MEFEFESAAEQYGYTIPCGNCGEVSDSSFCSTECYNEHCERNGIDPE